MSFHDLHQPKALLLLPNAWDVGSAIAFAEAGFEAIGTTSFGVGATSGHPDGGRSSRQPTVDLVAALHGFPAYVSADIEDGYSDDPAEVADFVAALGAAGVNIEDSTGEELIDPASHAAKISAVKQASPDTFVNARIDNYWLGQDAEVGAVLARAQRYVDAGADGIFVPGATDPGDIGVLTSAISLPVNLLAVPTLTLQDLAALGVRRVSTGSLPYRAAMDAAVAAATTLRDGQPPMSATPYPQAQARLQNYADRAPSSICTG